MGKVLGRARVINQLAQIIKSLRDKIIYQHQRFIKLPKWVVIFIFASTKNKFCELGAFLNRISDSFLIVKLDFLEELNFSTPQAFFVFFHIS